MSIWEVAAIMVLLLAITAGSWIGGTYWAIEVADRINAGDGAATAVFARITGPDIQVQRWRHLLSVVIGCILAATMIALHLARQLP